jgi:hypothetical protein
MAANVDPVTVSNSTPEAKANARIAPTSAPDQQVSQLGSETRGPKQLATRRSLFTTGAAPANSTETQHVVSKAGLTSDEAYTSLSFMLRITQPSRAGPTFPPAFAIAPDLFDLRPLRLRLRGLE